jgi:hypothetical protein
MPRQSLQDLTALDAMTLTVRFLLELAALAALGWWGAKTGETTVAKLALGAGAPLAAAVVWGTFVAPKATIAVPGAVHIALQVLVFGAAALALLSIEKTVAAELFASAVVIDTALVYARGL